MSANEFIRYRHGGAQNWVYRDLQGMDESVNLCSVCRHFAPGFPSVHCPRATILEALQKAFGMVTVVWECNLFVPWRSGDGEKGGHDELGS